MTIQHLPEINFAELEPAAIESSVITIFEKLVGRTLYPGDPERPFLEALAYFISVQNSVIDLPGKQNLFAYSQKDHTDQLGYLMHTPRLDPSAAVTSIRFRLEEPLRWPVLITEGSRCTAAGSGQAVFSLDRSAVIEPGQTFVDVPATCLSSGTRFNGLVPGQINRMVDVIPYVKEVHNAIGTALGADREEDADYRRRIQLAPEPSPVAGP